MWDETSPTVTSVGELKRTLCAADASPNAGESERTSETIEAIRHVPKQVMTYLLQSGKRRIQLMPSPIPRCRVGGTRKPRRLILRLTHYRRGGSPGATRACTRRRVLQGVA